MSKTSVKQAIHNKNIKKKAEEAKAESAFFNLKPYLGYFAHNWGLVLIGARQAGKSYSITDFFCHQFKEFGIPFYWMRMTQRQAQLLLANNAEKLVDPDLRRRYDLDLVVSGNNVYNVEKRSKPDKNGKTKILEKKLFARVYAISTYYQQKGAGYDKDFLNDDTMRYNICIDEMNPEKGERKMTGDSSEVDLLYRLANQLENIVRNEQKRVRCFFLGNTTTDSSALLMALNFIPETFGVFHIARKKVVIVNIEPTEAYKKMRENAILNLLMPESGNVTNKIDWDKTLISKERLYAPVAIIKFSKETEGWFTVWQTTGLHQVICRYNKEQGKPVIAMKPYLDAVYNVEGVKNVISMFDYRMYYYRDLITFGKFQQRIMDIKPRGTK